MKRTNLAAFLLSLSLSLVSGLGTPFSALAATVPAFSRPLSSGVSGADVSQLQQFLAEQGFFTHEITDYFGSITKQAVIDFQKANGIDPIGVVGPATQAKILALAAGVGGVALASAVVLDTPQGTLSFAEEARARVSHIAQGILAGAGEVADTARANMLHLDFGENLLYSRTAQTAQAASADNGGFGSWIGGWLCRIFGNCGETVMEEAPPKQNFQNVPTEYAPSMPTSTAQQQSATTTIVNQYITQPSPKATAGTAQPVVERTERGAPTVGIDEAALNSKLSILKNDLLSRIAQAGAAGSASYTPVYVSSPSGNFVPRDLFDRQVDAIWNGIALSNRIDSLSGTDLSDITVDGVSGLTDTDIPDSITASNYLALTGGALTGAITNSAGATSTFSGPLAASVLNVSTTTATSTFASGINLTAGCFSVNGVCITGGSGSSASTTLLSDTNTWTGGNIFANATSTNLAVTGVASTSALVASNSFTFKNVTGFLKATAGAVATALIDLASDVTGILPVGNGGTGWSNFATGAIPYGNGSSALATTSAGTAGNVLALLNGVPTWTATTTFSGGLTFSGGNVTLDNTGAWTGTFDGQEGSYYLNAANLTNFGTPFYQLFSATNTDALSQGSTNKYYANSLVQSFVHSSSTIPKTYTANVFSALQSFGNASTTRLSVFDRLYVGGAATTTLQGDTTGTSTLQGFLNVLGTNSTSTFSGRLAAQYLTITGTAATSTAANGFNLTAGCFSVNGVCIGGSPSQWTTSGSNIYFNTGSVLIGTTTAGRTLTVFNTAANAQQRISYDATRYAEFYVDASGDLQISATGKNIRALDANLYLCDGGACPTTPVQGYPSFSSQGNAVLAGTVYTTGIAPVTCPTGMIPVPPMPEVGLYHGFCVDKYEAKSNSGNQESVAAGTPWVSITQYNAIAECRRAGKHLITEPEWMAIARNVEDVGWNWNGGVAGTNNMSDGHSDNSPASALAADVTGDADDDPCVGTGQTCSTSTWDSQRRTYQLSNGSYIWDFAGNVWEWVDQANQEDYPVANSGAAGWQACSTSGDGVCGNTRTTNDRWYRGASTALRGFIRGGSWADGANDGAFTLYLGNAPGTTGTNIGFRCAR